MPKVVLHKLGQVHEGVVKDNSNLVVRAGIKQFPFPHLRYGCGMGKCSKCACEVLAGAEHLPPPNWKEEKLLRDNLARGYRLICQLWIDHDIELRQDSDEVWAATIRPPELAAAAASALRPAMAALRTSVDAKPAERQPEGPAVTDPKSGPAP